MPRSDLTPMAMRLDESPWQHLPEMAENFRNERAGIEAGLRVVEILHHHRAKARRALGNNLEAIRHLDRAAATAALCADIVGVMK